EFLIVEQIADTLLLAAQECINLFHPFDMDTGRADEGQGSQPRRVADGEVGGDPAAERAADEMDLVQVELVEKVEVEIGEIGNVVEPIRRVGRAETGMLGNDNVEFFRQSCHAGQPDTDAAAAVQEDERRATAAAHETNAALPDRDHLVAM